MSTDITGNNDTNTKRTAGAICAGLATMHFTKKALRPLFVNLPAKSLDNINKTANLKITEEQKEKLLKVSGLKEKGVRIIDFAGKEKDFGEIQSGLVDRLKRVFKNRNYTTMQKVKASLVFVQRVNSLNEKSAVSKGSNALAYSDCHKVLINTDKLGLALPHELGHCKNYTSKFWRIVRRSVPRFKAVAALIALTGICTRKKADEKKTDGAVDAVKTFIKNNTGTLTAAMFVPEIADELLATHNGNKYAKRVFSADIAKNIAKNNKYGALTYLGFAAAAGIAAWTGSKVRDLIA